MTTRRILPVATLFIFLSIQTFAANTGTDISWRGSGGWGVGLPYAMRFDPGTVGSFSGEIVKVEKVVPLHGMTEGVAVTLRNREETLTVQLGPLWFLERQDALMLLPGDTLEVRGSRVAINGEKGMIATEMARKGRGLRLRDEQGLPVWSAWRQQ